jgi:hypothetical protein
LEQSTAGRCRRRQASAFVRTGRQKQTNKQPTNPMNKHATATPQWQTLWVFHEDGTATSAARVALNQADTLKPQRNRPYDDRKRTDAGKHTHVERQLVVGRNMRVGKLAQVEVSAAQQRVNVLTQRGTPSTVTQAGALTASSAGAHRACRRRRSAAGTRSPSSGAASSRPPWRPASQPQQLIDEQPVRRKRRRSPASLTRQHARPLCAMQCNATQLSQADGSERW